MKILSRHSQVAALLAICLATFQCQPAETDDTMEGPATVEVREVDGSFALYLNGEPYELKGAGLEFGNMEALASNGGNSFRTWRTDNARNTGQEVLDMALENGLTVSMCLEVMRERHGFDYDNEEAVARQFEKMKAEVLKYKDHPALLTWIIGNELNHHYENPAVYDAVNEISEMIHEVDPHHPTTTTTAGITQDLVNVIKERAPDLDFLSVQSYGDIVNVPGNLESYGWTGPYMVTEWGATGHWEIDTTSWGAPIEQNSSVKASNYLTRYEAAIAPYQEQCIGSYVFLWGNKQERTPTWYGMFLEDGSNTEAVDVMHYLWNGSWPANRSPQLDSMKMADKTAYENVIVLTGQVVEAEVFANDPEADSLTYTWEILRESQATQEGGDDEEVPESMGGLISGSGSSISITAPAEEGAYRLFVYIRDGNGNAAHANIPFYVGQ